MIVSAYYKLGGNQSRSEPSFRAWMSQGMKTMSMISMDIAFFQLGIRN